MKGYHEHQDTARGTRWRWMVLRGHEGGTVPSIVVASVDRRRRAWQEFPARLLGDRRLLAFSLRCARDTLRSMLDPQTPKAAPPHP